MHTRARAREEQQQLLLRALNATLDEGSLEMSEGLMGLVSGAGCLRLLGCLA